ncbi:Calcineurin-like phosphoesterase superfamily domain protein [uncultured archaeon]|nr:Calcineurin-like phosphoesterase superfamily domain protein [uncultured archaeon]
MKIIAISDTHIKEGSILAQIPAGLVRLIKDADIVIHAGDFVTKEAYDELSGICRLEAVHGNMDEPELKRMLPARKVIELDGFRFGIIHEAALSIQDTIGARYMAKEMEVDVLIFGHIHRPLIEKSDVLLACPGSPIAPRLSEPAAIEFSIEDGSISGKVITLEGTRCGALESAREFGKSD